MTETQKMKSFEQACDPLIKWLNENCHPHVCVVVEPTRAELLEGQMAIKNEKHLRD